MIQLLTSVFFIGYLAIVFEHKIKVEKTVSAILTGVLLWVLASSFLSEKIHETNEALLHHLSEIAAILFFLMAAMTIVEIIDSYQGFEIITSLIKTENPKKLLVLVSIFCFFLSALLDNLTTTIIMVTLLKKLLGNRDQRLYFVGLVIIAANAGGAWSPIGDVTTTMLWIGGQISASHIIKSVFLPSLVSLLIPTILISFRFKSQKLKLISEKKVDSNISKNEKRLVFWTGILGLISVPIFKTYTHLPPFMGILLALGVLWLITEFLQKKTVERLNSVTNILMKIDLNSILFFLGILLSVSALQYTGVLNLASVWLSENFKNQTVLLGLIGILSAVIDNVPLVAAAMGMYSTAVYNLDHPFWILLAYCAGTGGSLLIIGSAAGVAAMGLEKIDFFWYLKNITLYGLIGYLAGIGVYLVLNV